MMGLSSSKNNSRRLRQGVYHLGGDKCKLLDGEASVFNHHMTFLFLMPVVIPNQPEKQKPLFSHGLFSKIKQ